MKDKRIQISIVSLFVLIMFIGLLYFMPISVSFGEHDDRNSDRRNISLQPGFYFVYLKNPMKLPDGMELVAIQGNWTPGLGWESKPFGFIGTGFFHAGKGEKKDKEFCMGPIITLLQDNGSMKYKCMKCGKVWPKPSDGN